MMKNLCVLLLCVLSLNALAQNEVDVADITLKVGGLATEELMYGFAEGDKVIFTMTETDGKELKEVSIEEYPNTIKYQNRATAKIENKILNVSRKGIFKFSFYNSNVKGRVINIVLKRIPLNAETANFNTKVVWRDVIDTAYRAEQNQYLIKSDTSFVEVINTTSTVHSELNSKGNKTLVDFTLPANTVKWAFWIGVGQEAKKAYQKDVQALSSTVGEFAGMTNPLAGLLIGILPALTKTSNGENVMYRFMDGYENAQKFANNQQYLQFKQGNVVSDYCNMPLYKSQLGRKLYIGLINDNTMQPIDVTTKITAMVVKNQYETRTDKVPVITNKRKPFIEE